MKEQENNQWFDELRRQHLKGATRNPGAAALMSFFVMGLGQIYAGHIDRGIMLMAIYFGGIFSLTIDTRNSQALPDRGVNWVTTLRSLSGTNDFSYDRVTQLNSDFSVYLKLIPEWLVLANRTGGGMNLGKKGFEFFQAQYLGSDDNLRGYRKERFAGKSKFYNQTELRLKLANLKTYLFPAAIGVLPFLMQEEYGRKTIQIKKC